MYDIIPSYNLHDTCRYGLLEPVHLDLGLFSCSWSRQWIVYVVRRSRLGQVSMAIIQTAE